MLNCDYTGNTSYKFYNKCIIESEDINIVGEYPANKIEKALTCLEIISQRVIKTPVVMGYTNTAGNFISGENIPNAECTNLTGRKLIIEGLLKQKVIYTADDDEQSLHSANFEIPFSTFIIIEKDTPLSQQFRITPYIEDIFVSRLSERSVFKNTTIFIKASKVC